MSPRDWRIPRRAFLRGAGAAVALPMLDAMAPALAASAAKPPVRMAFLYFPNGAWGENWIPRDSGYDYVLPFSLEPIKPVQDDVLILSGLDKAASRHQIKWEWSEGHTGHVIQEAADKAARRIAKLGHAEESILRDAVDSVGTLEVPGA